MGATKLQDPQARAFYLQKTVEHSWSRAVLTVQIESGLYELANEHEDEQE
ncbi:MAG: DUF1016 N-terminal domain-containing protein [Myxococcota bacterium]